MAARLEGLILTVNVAEEPEDAVFTESHGLPVATVAEIVLPVGTVTVTVPVCTVVVPAVAVKIKLL